MVRPDHLGDVLFTTPALRLLRSTLPDARITCLVGPWSRVILERNENVDEIVTFDFPWFNRRKKANLLEPYGQLKRLADALRSGSFDVAINLRFDFWWGALATYLAGIPSRIGYDVDACRPFLTDVCPYESGRHEVERDLRLVELYLRHSATPSEVNANLSASRSLNPDQKRGAGACPPLGVQGQTASIKGTVFGSGETPGAIHCAPTDTTGTTNTTTDITMPGVGARFIAPDPCPPLNARGLGGSGSFFQQPGPARRASPSTLDYMPAEDDERIAAALLSKNGVGEGETIVALHPGSGAAVKLWTAEGFARVGNELARMYGCRIIVTGSAAERGLASEIARLILDAGNACVPLVLAGETSLAQLATVFKRCRLVIGVDSGAMHLAVAAGAPTIHLFGPSDHVAFGPYGDAKMHRVVRATMPCSPCGRLDSTCGKTGVSDCMAAITPQQVIAQAMGILATRGGDARA